MWQGPLYKDINLQWQEQEKQEIIMSKRAKKKKRQVNPPSGNIAKLLYSYVKLLLKHQAPLLSAYLWSGHSPLSWLICHWPAALVLHLQLILEGIWRGGFGWAVAPFEPEGLVAEGSALQTGWLWRQGLRLQLKGVTKGASSQAVKGLDSNSEEEIKQCWKDWDIIRGLILCSLAKKPKKVQSKLPNTDTLV